MPRIVTLHQYPSGFYPSYAGGLLLGSEPAPFPFAQWPAVHQVLNVPDDVIDADVATQRNSTTSYRGSNTLDYSLLAAPGTTKYLY
jgi:hypothetical protein